MHDEMFVQLNLKIWSGNHQGSAIFEEAQNDIICMVGHLLCSKRTSVGVAGYFLTPLWMEVIIEQRKKKKIYKILE